MGGSFPRSVIDMISAERMLSVTNLLVVARAKAYSARIADSTDRIPSTSKSCDVCMKKPSLLRSSLRLCMGCRRNACRKCRESCTVFRLNLRTQKPSKEIFCTQCISDVTRPTMSAFHMCSLHENTNDSVNHYQCVGLDSVVSGEKNSTGHSSNRSHDSSDIDSDAWLPAPIDLDGLASFVERASVATSGELQWNQDELDHYADILRESGHFEIPQFSDQNNNGNCQRSQNQKQDYDPSNSLPSSVYFKFDPKVSRSYATDNSSAPKDAHHKFFCADDLD
ncbi:unnamed protein product [Peronospora belbahrii]|uniref:FYVE-type domain-containing protein n=1 Tax=Peronospora belbahrii TaxID=622444 RepID=A0ABN8CTU9_9STRA|nr:unnamed protein product [Peronospora belbahrii]